MDHILPTDGHIQVLRSPTKAPLTQREVEVFYGIKHVHENQANKRTLDMDMDMDVDVDTQEKLDPQQKSKLSRVREILAEMTSLTKGFDEQEDDIKSCVESVFSVKSVSLDHGCSLDHGYSINQGLSDENDANSCIESIYSAHSVHHDHGYSVLPDLSDEEDDETSLMNKDSSLESMPTLNRLELLLRQQLVASSQESQDDPEISDVWFNTWQEVSKCKQEYLEKKSRRRLAAVGLDYEASLSDRLADILFKTDVAKDAYIAHRLSELEKQPQEEVGKPSNIVCTRMTRSLDKKSLLRIDVPIQESIKSYGQIKKEVTDSDEKLKLLNEISKLKRLLEKKDALLKTQRTRTRTTRTRTKSKKTSTISISSQAPHVTPQSSQETSCTPISSLPSPSVPIQHLLLPIPSPTGSSESCVSASSRCTYDSFMETLLKKKSSRSQASSSGYSSAYSCSTSCSTNVGRSSHAFKKHGLGRVGSPSFQKKVLDWNQLEDPRTPPTPLFWDENASDVPRIPSPINFDGLF